MSGSIAPEPLLGGRKCLCHFTYVESLPDIAASGGLLSTDGRTSPPAHNWGANDDLGRGYVCTSLKPSWGILGAMGGADAALLVFGLNATLAGRRHLYVPLNSGSPRARPYMNGEVPDVEASSECVANASAAEILVADSVPLTTLRGLMFYSRASRDHWWPVIHANLNGAALHLDLGAWFFGEPRSPGGFRFPNWYSPRSATHSGAAGLNRSRALTVRPLEFSPRDAITAEDVERDFADEDWLEDDPDARDLRDELAAEREDYAQEMADLEDTGWYGDDADD